MKRNHNGSKAIYNIIIKKTSICLVQQRPNQICISVASSKYVMFINTQVTSNNIFFLFLIAFSYSTILLKQYCMKNVVAAT